MSLLSGRGILKSNTLTPKLRRCPWIKPLLLAPTITRAPVFVSRPRVNHGVGNRRIALNRRCRSKTTDRPASILSNSTNPPFDYHRLKILPAFRSHMYCSLESRGTSAMPFWVKNGENKTRAIHSAIRRIGRAVFVFEVPGRQLKGQVNKLPDFRRIIFVTGNLARRDRSRSPFLFGDGEAEDIWRRAALGGCARR